MILLQAIKDTTSMQYKIGYTIGSYLPVGILIIIVLLFIRHSYKFKQDKNS